MQYSAPYPITSEELQVIWLARENNASSQVIVTFFHLGRLFPTGLRPWGHYQEPSNPKGHLRVLQTFLSFTGCHNDLSVEFRCQSCSATPCCLRLPFKFSDLCRFYKLFWYSMVHPQTQAAFKIRWDVRKHPPQKLRLCAFYKLSVYSALLHSCVFFILPQLQSLKLHCLSIHLNQVTEQKPFLLSCITRHIILHIISFPQCRVFSQCWPPILVYCFSYQVICQFYYELLIPLNCLGFI